MNQPVEHLVQDLGLYQLWTVLIGLVNFLWKGLLAQQQQLWFTLDLGCLVCIVCLVHPQQLF